MPTYEYACRDCGSHLEVVQSFSDDPLTECPHCGGQLRKVFGSIGITFKGSGFYKTDSRSGSSSKRSAEPSGDGAKETKETKETKKETKAEPAAASSASSSGSGSDSSSSGTAKTA
jgi:putative FmdB family regulatory protein